MAYKEGIKRSEFYGIRHGGDGRWLRAHGWNSGPGWHVNYIGWDKKIVSLGRSRRSAQRVIDDLPRFLQAQIDEKADAIKNLHLELAKPNTGYKRSWIQNHIISLEREIIETQAMFVDLQGLEIMQVNVETNVVTNPV
jgi:hypothetical protein